MEVTFGLATMQEVERLVESVQKLYEFDRLPFDAAVTRDALSRLVTDPSLGQVRLMQRGGELIGYFVLAFAYSIEFGGRVLFVDELYVRPEDRGRGVGKRALKFIEELGCDLGIRALRLEVVHTNVVALDFYRKSDFKVDDRHLLTKVLPG